VLLDGALVIGVAGIEGFAVGEAFVLTMIEADPILAKAPTKIDFLVVDAGRKIEKADVEILDEAAGGMNALDGGLDGFLEAIALDAALRGFIVGDEQAAGTLDAFGESVEQNIELAHFAARLHSFDEDGLDLGAEALRFAEGEKFGFVVGHFLNCRGS
jgi:hypothetical protein